MIMSVLLTYGDFIINRIPVHLDLLASLYSMDPVHRVICTCLFSDGRSNLHKGKGQTFGGISMRACRRLLPAPCTCIQQT